MNKLSDPPVVANTGQLTIKYSTGVEQVSLISIQSSSLCVCVLVCIVVVTNGKGTVTAAECRCRVFAIWCSFIGSTYVSISNCIQQI